MLPSYFGEDYELAAGIKKRLNDLMKQSKELEKNIAEVAVKAQSDLLAARSELNEIIAKKLAAVENEDSVIVLQLAHMFGAPS